MSILNSLNIPKLHFGTGGINTGNIVNKILTEEERKYKATYDPENRRIIVQNSSDLPIETLDKMLYEKSNQPEYDEHYPKIKKKRDSNGNLLIKFVLFHPHGAISKLTPELKMLSKGNKGDVNEVQAALSIGVIKALNQIMSNKKQDFTGIWYPTDLHQYFLSKKKEMPSDYWTGYANDEYFEKIDKFTFKLKEGKSPSEAINALINGPSVLECGNAIQLAYYKAMLEVIGAEKFDKMFSNELFMLKIIREGITDEGAPISYFASYSRNAYAYKGEIGNRPVEVGETCHFMGIEGYGHKHPTGFGGGWNVVCIGKNKNGEQLFVAHGFDAPMTEREINTLLVEFYNRERTPEEETYILQEDKPHYYDKEKNDYLKYYYTVPVELEEQLMGGFVVGSSSSRGLDPKLVMLARDKTYSNNKFIPELWLSGLKL